MQKNQWCTTAQLYNINVKAYGYQLEELCDQGIILKASTVNKGKIKCFKVRVFQHIVLSLTLIGKKSCQRVTLSMQIL